MVAVPTPCSGVTSTWCVRPSALSVGTSLAEHKNPGGGHRSRPPGGGLADAAMSRTAEPVTPINVWNARHSLEAVQKPAVPPTVAKG